MTNPAEIDPLVQLVVEGEKPGALILITSDQEEQFHKSHDPLGLDIERVKSKGGFLGLVVARPQKASLVLENSAVVPYLHEIVDVSPLAQRIGGLSVAQALIQLENTRNIVEGRQQQPAEVAALEGSLLGYANCDVAYYVGVKYMGTVMGEASSRLMRTAMNPEAWPDVHLLCDPCAETKLEILGIAEQ